MCNRTSVSAHLEWPLAILISIASAHALIITSEGNSPVTDMGWPAGAEDVANIESRLGYWESPPFGGGEDHFLYACQDAAEFSEALQIFSRIICRKLELVVTDEAGRSFWMGHRSEKTDGEEDSLDWEFVIWKPENWHSLYNNPKSFMSASQSDRFRRPVPAPTIILYLGSGHIKWSDVKVPHNVTVIDERPEAAPIRPTDGGLVVGNVYDMTTGQPVAGARVIIHRRTEDNKWKEAARGEADDRGHVEIRKLTEGRFRIVTHADGFATRVIMDYRNAGQTYFTFDTELLPAVELSGTIVDTLGKPVSDVQVRTYVVLGIDGRAYTCDDLEPVATDDKGRFTFKELPKGFVQLGSHKKGLQQRTSIFELYSVPSREEIQLVMTGVGQIRGKATGDVGRMSDGSIHVNFRALNVAVERWGGSTRCKEDGTFELNGVPPGTYLISTKHMMHDKTDEEHGQRITVEVGKVTHVDLVDGKLSGQPRITTTRPS